VHDSSSTRTFAIWRVFHDAPRWWFAKGCPPTLRDARAWVRLLRMAILLGVMGGVAGMLAVALMFGLQYISRGVSSNGMMVLYALAGGLYGAMVLVPLSRWLGRSWWTTVLALPVAGAIFQLPLIRVLGLIDVSAVTESESAIWIAIHVVMGLAFAIWLGALWPRPCVVALIGGPVLTTLALLVMAIASWAMWEFPDWFDFQILMLLTSSSITCYAALLAIASGLPLVWCEDCSVETPVSESE
jgi:hypothetical protein